MLKTLISITVVSAATLLLSGCGGGSGGTSGEILDGGTTAIILQLNLIKSQQPKHRRRN